MIEIGRVHFIEGSLARVTAEGAIRKAVWMDSASKVSGASLSSRLIATNIPERGSKLSRSSEFDTIALAWFMYYNRAATCPQVTMCCNGTGKEVDTSGHGRW